MRGWRGGIVYFCQLTYDERSDKKLTGSILMIVFMQAQFSSCNFYIFITELITCVINYSLCPYIYIYTYILAYLKIIVGFRKSSCQSCIFIVAHLEIIVGF